MYAIFLVCFSIYQCRDHTDAESVETGYHCLLSNCGRLKTGLFLEGEGVVGGKGRGFRCG